MTLCRYFITLFLCIITILTGTEPALTLYLPMRDGFALPTDIYLPKGKTSDLPCILIRTPAGRAEHKKAYVPYTEAGYMVAIQDARSYVDPEGKTLPCIHDGWGPLQDGYDTVQWLAKSSMTNGKIGTLGFSAMGITQLMMAPAAPPSLKCQYIAVAPSNLYQHAFSHGGKFMKNQIEGWIGSYARHPSVLKHILSQGEDAVIWKHVDAISVADKTRTPAIHYGGWFDVFSQGTLDSYQHWQEKGGEGAKGKQKLVMGPWGHYWPAGVDNLGDFKVPQAGRKPPFDVSPLAWFEYHLKGENNEIVQLPNVVYYVMGPFDGSPSKGNIWKSSDHWPVPAEPTAFYLTQENTLKSEKPADSSSISYTYDPKDPTPTRGGRNLFLAIGPKDQKEIESREDNVVFTSELLKEDLEVTGRIAAKIWFTSDCEDTDVVVRLTDVYPDGKSILIADGIRRLHHVAPDKSDWSKPEEIEVDLWSTSIVFAKGHKIRVSISSANYPRFEKSYNVKKEIEDKDNCPIAHNAIYLGKGHPSQIVLPIVK